MAKLLNVVLAGIGERHVIADIVNFHLQKVNDLCQAICRCDAVLSLSQAAEHLPSAGHGLLVGTHVWTDSLPVRFASMEEFVVQPAVTQSWPLGHGHWKATGDDGHENKHTHASTHARACMHAFLRL
jgi:hypothetical protein